MKAVEREWKKWAKERDREYEKSRKRKRERNAERVYMIDSDELVAF